MSEDQFLHIYALPDHKPSFVPLARYDHLSCLAIADEIMRWEVWAEETLLFP